jgi:hypothetical protein
LRLGITGADCHGFPRDAGIVLWRRQLNAGA